MSATTPDEALRALHRIMSDGLPDGSASIVRRMAEGRSSPALDAQLTNACMKMLAERREDVVEVAKAVKSMVSTGKVSQPATIEALRKADRTGMIDAVLFMSSGTPLDTISSIASEYEVNSRRPQNIEKRNGLARSMAAAHAAGFAWNHFASSGILAADMQHNGWSSFHSLIGTNIAPIPQDYGGAMLTYPPKDVQEQFRAVQTAAIRTCDDLVGYFEKFFSARNSAVGEVTLAVISSPAVAPSEKTKVVEALAENRIRLPEERGQPTIWDVARVVAPSKDRAEFRSLGALIRPGTPPDIVTTWTGNLDISIEMAGWIMKIIEANRLEQHVDGDFLVAARMAAAMDTGVGDWTMDLSSPDAVAATTRNLRFSLDRALPIMAKLRHYGLVEHADEDFLAVAKTIESIMAGIPPCRQPDWRPQNWFAAHKLSVEAGMWRDLTNDISTALLYGMILGVLGLPIAVFMSEHGIKPSDFRERKDIAERARRVVQTMDVNPASRAEVERAKMAWESSQSRQGGEGSGQEISPFVRSRFDTSKTPQGGDQARGMDPAGQNRATQVTSDPAKTRPAPAGADGKPAHKGPARSGDGVKFDERMAKQLAGSHEYIASRISAGHHAQQGDYEIIKQVGEQYGLSDLALKMLLAIRVIENGPPGLEMGVGDGMPNHPARRLGPEKVGERNFDHQRSLRLQAEWAAGTIKRRFPKGKASLKSAVKALASRYCERAEHWASLMSKFLMST